MIPPKHTNARKRALLIKLGYDPSNVVDDGSFDEDGFTILEQRPEEGEVSVSPVGKLWTRIEWWTPEIRQRAIDAIDGDCRESMKDLRVSQPEITPDTH